MQRKVVFAILALVLVLGTFGALVLAACGSDDGDTGAREESAAPSAAATGEPLKIGFDEGFTGFMAVDADLTDKGIELAIEQLGGQIGGRPIEYIKADNGSDPVQAVDKARQLVESDKIDVMIGPIFSPANAAVTDYLAKERRHPVHLHLRAADRQHEDGERTLLRARRPILVRRLPDRQVRR